MMGISLFGTCTMKYNPRLDERARRAARDRRAPPAPGRRHAAGRARDRARPRPDPARAVGHGRSSSSRPGGGADAAYTHACVTRAYHAVAGRARSSATRSITTIQAHPCNAATAAAAGFKVITLPLEENGYPSLDALQGRGLRPHGVADGQQPRRHGHLQPRHRASGSTSSTRPAGLCFYDHANFNGVMGKIARPRARLRRLHVHAPQDVRRAEGRRRPGRRRVRLHATSWRRSCPGPIVVRDGERYRLDATGPRASARCASSSGNVPQIVKAYAWARAMGADGITRGVRHLGAREQLHGEAAARDPRRHASRTRTCTSAATGDDALQPRAR